VCEQARQSGELVAARVDAQINEGVTPNVEQIDSFTGKIDLFDEAEAKFTATDRRPRSSHPACVPSDLPSRLPSFADAGSSCQAPIRNARPSIANNHSSKHSQDQAQPFSFRLAPAAAPP
jgi:hypothetical protein